jgi:two-component system, chemotaxis family, sensor histidine kinase and response regulator WspE
VTESAAKSEVDSDLIALFVVEVDTVAPRLQELVLSIEADGAGLSEAEDAMRIAHSLKGAARIVGLTEIVATLHAAEDALSSARDGRVLSPAEIQALLRLVDLLVELTRVGAEDVARWLAKKRGALEEMQGALRRSVEPRPTAATARPAVDRDAAPAPGAAPESRALRLSADSVSRLLGLAGETVVEARRLHAWSRSIATVERAQAQVV